MYMFSKKYKEDEFNTLSVLVFFYRWRTPFIAVSVISILISTIVAFVIKPKFKSAVVLFPSTNVSASKALLSENPGAKQDIGQFGEQEEAEQLLQILYSDDIRTRIIQKYNLEKHYEINPNSQYKMTELIDKFEDNITFKLTEYLSVKVTVYDTDPQTAANIANDIAALSDSIHNKIIKQRSVKALKLVETKYLKLFSEIKADEDSLVKLRMLGVNDYETQSERFHEAYAKAILENKQGAIKMFQDKLDNLSKYGGGYVSLRDNLEFKRKQLSFIKSKFEEAKLDAEQDLPYKFLVNSAFKAEKKAYPLRWAIILLSFISAQMLLAFGLILLENYKKLRK